MGIPIYSGVKKGSGKGGGGGGGGWTSDEMIMPCRVDGDVYKRGADNKMLRPAASARTLPDIE